MLTQFVVFNIHTYMTLYIKLLMCNYINPTDMSSSQVIQIRPPREELSQSIQTNIKCPIEGCKKVLPQTSALTLHMVKTHKIVEVGSEFVKYNITSSTKLK